MAQNTKFQFPRDRLPAQFILINKVLDLLYQIYSTSAEFTPQDKFRPILLYPFYLDFAVTRADFDPIARFDLVA